MRNFTQVDERQRRESLRPIAILALEPRHLSERYGLTFHPDARDDTTAALLETGRGRQYMLLRHSDAPGPGTEVLAPEHSADPHRDLIELLDALQLDPRLVSWELDGEVHRESPVV